MQTIDLYTAIRAMDQLSKENLCFSFAFYKFNSQNGSGGDLARIARAQLRAKTPDSQIANSSFKLFFTDMDTGKALVCWQPLIVDFNGMKVKLN